MPLLARLGHLGHKFLSRNRFGCFVGSVSVLQVLGIVVARSAAEHTGCWRIHTPRLWCCTRALDVVPELSIGARSCIRLSYIAQVNDWKLGSVRLGIGIAKTSLDQREDDTNL